MQKAAQASKRRILFDGFELPGLVMVSEAVLEMGQLEIPEFGVNRKVSNGVKVIPPMDLTFRCDRDTEVESFISDWFEERDPKDAVVIYTDGHGVEYRRELWQQCEIVKKSEPAYDALTPTFMQYQITLLPWDIIDID